MSLSSARLQPYADVCAMCCAFDLAASLPGHHMQGPGKSSPWNTLVSRQAQRWGRILAAKDALLHHICERERQRQRAAELERKRQADIEQAARLREAAARRAAEQRALQEAEAQRLAQQQALDRAMEAERQAERAEIESAARREAERKQQALLLHEVSLELYSRRLSKATEAFRAGVLKVKRLNWLSLESFSSQLDSADEAVRAYCLAREDASAKEMDSLLTPVEAAGTAKASVLVAKLDELLYEHSRDLAARWTGRTLIWATIDCYGYYEYPLMVAWCTLTEQALQHHAPWMAQSTAPRYANWFMRTHSAKARKDEAVWRMLEELEHLIDQDAEQGIAGIAPICCRYNAQEKLDKDWDDTEYNNDEGKNEAEPEHGRGENEDSASDRERREAGEPTRRGRCDSDASGHCTPPAAKKRK